MRLLSTIQAILALAFLLFGAVTLFAIGITGLLFLLPGLIFAGTAALTEKASRGGAALALAADAVLAYLAARRLVALLTQGMPGIKFPYTVNAFDYLVPAVALALVGAAVLALAWDWRAVRDAPWF